MKLALPLIAHGLVLVLVIFPPFLVITAVETRYIDDEIGDPSTGLKPIYMPSDQWGVGTACTDCNIRPNAELAYNGTWHDTTHLTTDPEPRSMQLTFTGIGLSVFCIIPPSSAKAKAIINYDLTFTLDGLSVRNGFSLQPNNTDYQYNVPVITLKDLSNKQHEFIMEASSTTTDSVVLFDYATYLFDNSSTITSSSSSAASGPSVTTTSRTDGNSSASGSSKINTGTIIGGVIAGVLGFLLGVVSAVFLRRRRRQMHKKNHLITPFVQSLYTHTRSKGQPGTWRQLQDHWPYLPTVGSTPAAPQRNVGNSEPSGPPGPPPTYEE